ncbi:thiamine ABC transporter permease [Bacillus sp. MUM 116]|uniref:ECF transporter S component n=1 Tax=Bacillus sp. MUM 116 TaxID=1678002 RepID=UPI0008F59888|nr:ECF transporter S component [Bacillus sp. MUM 116]OIK16875.1 thiamine ABC transporter permease [Bacillus sp. MUM 116]
MKRSLTLTDVLVTVVISIVFGLIYKLWSPLYYAVKPIGLHIDQLIYGMWFIAATVAFLIIRKPGVAFLAEIAAASGEFLAGSEFGLEALLYGAMQGLFAEIIFALFMYKRYSLFVTCLAAFGSGLASIIMDSYKGYIGDLALWNLTLFVGARLIGTILIAGVGAYYLVKALEETKVTTILRTNRQEHYDALDK